MKITDHNVQEGGSEAAWDYCTAFGAGTVLDNILCYIMPVPFNQSMLTGGAESCLAFRIVYIAGINKF